MGQRLFGYDNSHVIIVQPSAHRRDPEGSSKQRKLFVAFGKIQHTRLGRHATAIARDWCNWVICTVPYTSGVETI